MAIWNQGEATMRRIAWAAVLILLAGLAIPAGAAPRVGGGVGGIHGVITDSTTGQPFDLTGGGLISVDVFNLATGHRVVRWISGTDDGAYDFAALAVGDYKMRFRYWNAADQLAAYRWYNDKANFQVANTVTVVEGASLTANVTLKPLAGAPVSGTIAEQGTLLPLNTACYNVQLFEAGGIGLGILSSPDASGNWELASVPAGRWAALAYVLTGVIDPDGPGGEAPVDCGTSPAHLDAWYRGAAGWPLAAGVIADPHTFPSAGIFRVVAGAAVDDIDFALLPAPTCRGKVPTIFGTTLADVINGTGARDIISGLAGNDIINGRTGNDLLCGDGGADTLKGGPGTDAADGGLGKDVCAAETTWRCP
jgi:hypothetical protein